MQEAGKSRQWTPTVPVRPFIGSPGTAATIAATGIGSAQADRQLFRLEESAPTAKALDYLHNGKAVDAAKRFSYQFCNNCALFTGESGDEWAGCSIFPGKGVAGQGWCSVWSAKQ